MFSSEFEVKKAIPKRFCTHSSFSSEPDNDEVLILIPKPVAELGPCLVCKFFFEKALYHFSFVFDKLCPIMD
jgi:hypothetical protein